MLESRWNYGFTKGSVVLTRVFRRDRFALLVVDSLPAHFRIEYGTWIATQHVNVFMGIVHAYTPHMMPRAPAGLSPWMPNVIPIAILSKACASGVGPEQSVARKYAMDQCLSQLQRLADEVCR